MDDQEAKDKIVACGEHCERWMALESTYVLSGDFVEAAVCADNAEAESAYAFAIAKGFA